MYYLNNTTYNEKTLIGRLRRYFLIYFETFSVSTADSLFLLILSILALESAHSIRFLYHHFLSGITKKIIECFLLCLNSSAKNMSLFSVTAGIQRKIWSLLLMNIQTLISLAMQGLILSCMISLLNGLGAEDVLPSMENGFALKQILLFPRKRSVIIIQVSAGFSQRSLATEKFLLLSRILKRKRHKTSIFQHNLFRRSEGLLYGGRTLIF